MKNPFKKKVPETYKILVTENKHSSSGRGIVGLVELFFKKYGFKYKEFDDESKDFLDRLHHYEIIIDYKDKDYVEVLLNKIFKRDNRVITIGEYERWLKTERLRRKILNI